MYIDLVLCKHTSDGRYFLFQAPLGSMLNEGDLVIVETKRGEQVASVVAVETVAKGSGEFNFIIKASGANLPLKKVLRRMIYIDMEYKEGAED